MPLRLPRPTVAFAKALVSRAGSIAAGIPGVLEMSHFGVLEAQGSKSELQSLTH